MLRDGQDSITEGSVAGSNGCATAAGPRDLRLRHDGKSLPAPFLPVKVGSVDFPIDKEGYNVFNVFCSGSIC